MKLLLKRIYILGTFGILFFLSACYDHHSIDQALIQTNGLQPVNLKFTDKFEFKNFEISRKNWDEYQVDYQIVLSINQELMPAESFVAYVLDKDENELYRTSEFQFSYFDGNFHSEEIYKIKCCAIFGNEKICREQSFKASKKQIEFSGDIQYPLEKSIFLGEYQMDCQMFRSQFGTTDQLEKINCGDQMNYHLSVYSSDHPETKLTLQLQGHSGVFNLSNNSLYPQFKKIIESEITERSGSQLNFEFANIWDVESAAKTIQREIGHYKIERKSNQVSQYAYTAAKKLMKLVEPKSGYESRGHIQNWTYQEKDGFYAITINAQWKSEWYIDETMKVNGTLYIKPDGKNATFKFKFANDPVRDLEEWQGRRLYSTLKLGDFSS